MAIKLKCKEPHCGEELTYIREVVTGQMTLEESKDHETASPGWRTVFMTCSRGHVHPYSIKRSEFFE